MVCPVQRKKCDAQHVSEDDVGVCDDPYNFKERQEQYKLNVGHVDHTVWQRVTACNNV